MDDLIEEVRAHRDFEPRAFAGARRAAGVTQRRLAQELGVHYVTLSRWETGALRPSSEAQERWRATIVRIARELEAG